MRALPRASCIRAQRIGKTVPFIGLRVGNFQFGAQECDAAFDTIDATWGGEDGYFEQALGLSAAARDRLRDLLLEP